MAFSRVVVWFWWIVIVFCLQTFNFQKVASAEPQIVNDQVSIKKLEIEKEKEKTERNSIERLEFLVPLSERIALGQKPKLEEILSPEHEIHASGRVVYRFNGLEYAITKRISSYYRSYVNRYFQERFLGKSFSLPDHYEHLQRFADAEGDIDSGGRWWERAWNDSLVPEKGGWARSPEVITIGKTTEIFTCGDLFSLTNEGKLRLGSLSFWVDKPFVQRNSRTDRAVDDIRYAEGVGLNFVPEPQSRLRGHARGNILTTDWITVNLKGSVRFRLPDFDEMNPLDMVAQIGADVEIALLRHKKPWGRLLLKIQDRPRDSKVDFTASFELLTW